MTTITHNLWSDGIQAWELEHGGETLLFWSAQSVADYVFDRGLCADWKVIHHP